MANAHKARRRLFNAKARASGIIGFTLLTTAWQAAQADALRPRPETGTATGEYRTGLAREGLVELVALDNARLWLGLNAMQDSSARFDVQVELLQNGSAVASGLGQCLGGFDRDLAPAEVVIPWAGFNPQTLNVGDILSLRVSARIGTDSQGKKCKGASHADGLRLYHGSSEHASGLGVTITPDPAVELYLGSTAMADCNASALQLSEASPASGSSQCKHSGEVRANRGLFGGLHQNSWVEIGTWDLAPQVDYSEAYLPEVRNSPPAPEPETLLVEWLPLPPTAPSGAPGACDASVNPNGTGCIVNVGQLGGFIDSRHIVGNVTFGGAEPGSIYSGSQLIITRTDGTAFANGDTWKCITCGVPPENRQGASRSGAYPQPFRDLRRLLAGTNIIDCSPHRLTDEACTPEATRIYPIVFDIGSTQRIVQRLRELRIHPDDTHLGWNTVVLSDDGGFDQYGAFGRLEFRSAAGAAPAHYELTNVSFLLNTGDTGLSGRQISVDPENPDRLLLDDPAGHIGEFRGFTSDGRAALGIGTYDSCNWDPWATDLQTGKSRRLGRNPNYMDPMSSSPDDQWTVIEDGRIDDRMAFLGALPGVPPVIDLVGCALRDIYNNEPRRFFWPYLLDRYGDRGSYQGQWLLEGGDPTPGSNSISDPFWASLADPQWSEDGTSIAFYQGQIRAPACGGDNPIICPETSGEPGNRKYRWLIVRLLDREPLNLPDGPFVLASDEIPWGTPYRAGDPIPQRSHIPGGNYTLYGDVYGSADVTIIENEDKTGLAKIIVEYDNYSHDGINIVNGIHSRTRSGIYHEALQLSGAHEGQRVTSQDGWFYQGEVRYGTLSTTIDGVTYTSPPSHQ